MEVLTVSFVVFAECKILVKSLPINKLRTFHIVTIQVQLANVSIDQFDGVVVLGQYGNVVCRFLLAIRQFETDVAT